MMRFVKAKGWKTVLLGVILAGWMGGCTLKGNFTEIKTAKDLKPGQIVYVGQVVFDPPLSGAKKYEKKFFEKRDEQRYNTTEADNDFALRAAGKISWYTGNNPNPYTMDELNTFEVLKTAVGGKDGELWFYGGKKEPIYFKNIIAYQGIGVEVKAYNYLMSYKIAPKAEDQAIYFGKLVIHHNEFFDATKIELVDDYKKANQEFEKKFGKELKLEKRLMVPVKQ